MNRPVALILPLIFLLACGPAATPTPEMRTPTPEPTPIIFPTPLPTPTPAPTPDFSAVFSALGDLQTTLDDLRGSTGFSGANGGEASTKNEGDSYELVNSDGNSNAGLQTDNDGGGTEGTHASGGAISPTVTPTPAPTIIPTPTATPPVGFYVSAAPSAAKHLPSIVDGLSAGVVWAGEDLRRVSVSGAFENRGDLQPTMVQVWQAQRTDGTLECSTARPVAFVVPGSDNIALGTTVHRWRYCIKDGSNYVQESEVPWFRASSWTFTERKRQRTTDPRIWDFSMSADFDSPESLANEYYEPSGWRVVVFSGDVIIGYLWVGM